MEEGYVELYRPASTQELLLIKLHLDAAGVAYFVANENFSSLLPDLGLADMRLMVAPQHAERCAEILAAQLGIQTPRRP
jgi:flagellar biosynthesis/type III secretory pathway M-ring protein FliF/YscJ